MNQQMCVSPCASIFGGEMVEGSICPCSSKPSAFNNIPIILLLVLRGRGLAQRSGLAPPATVLAEAEQSENLDGRCGYSTGDLC